MTKKTDTHSETWTPKKTKTTYEFGGCKQFFWLFFWILLFWPMAIVYYFMARKQVITELPE